MQDNTGYADSFGVIGIILLNFFAKNLSYN
jgi:hypothetical protein